MNDIVLAVLAVTLALAVVRQLSHWGPPVWACFVGGAAAMVALQGISPAGAADALLANDSVPLFLLGLFVLAAGLEESGLLERIAHTLVGVARSPADLPALVFVAFGLLSALVVNDAVVLIGAPTVLLLARRIGRPAPPLLLALMLGVTVGSVATPFGNPQNLLVALNSGVASPVVTFARYLLLPTGLSLAGGAWIVRRAFPHEYPRRGSVVGPVASDASKGLGAPRRLDPVRNPTLVILPVTLGALVATSVAEGAGVSVPLPLDGIALVGAAVAFALTTRRGPLIRGVDLPILALFLALFVVVGAASSGGVLAALAAALHVPPSGNGTPGLLTLVLANLVGSQLVSNVPWVALQIPLLHGLGYGSTTPIAWVALAASSTLAGNLTLLGAASNLIVVEAAERRGVVLGLREFARVGLPVAALSVGLLSVCLVFGV